MYFLITDGSCSNNPGPGGWCCIIKSNTTRETVSGSETITTNQRMELLAAIKGLEKIPPRQDVVLTSDSQYLVYTMTKGWKRRANNDLWAQLDALVARTNSIDWVWVEGHNGHPDNEEANRVAQLETERMKEALNEATRIRGAG